VNEQDLQFVRAVLARLPDGPTWAYLKGLQDSDFSIDTVETKDDTLLIGVYSIRRYTDTERRPTLSGKPVLIDREFWEVTVEYEVPGIRSWEDGTTDLKMIHGRCQAFADALGELILADAANLVRRLIITTADPIGTEA